MFRLFVAAAAVALVGCESMTHIDGNTVSIRHEHIGTGWEPYVTELAVTACRQAGKTGAELMGHRAQKPDVPLAIAAKISTYRCV